MTAVHFGAGNIGRGFIGLLLYEAGHEIVFADIDAKLIAELNATPTYRVREAGHGGKTTVVTDYSGIDSRADPQWLVAEIAAADIVTTAVGPNVLRSVAPLIADAIRVREPERDPLVVMACENAIGASDILRTEIQALVPAGALAGRAVFANTAVDRIVPEQRPAGLDVVVEPYSEWIIDSAPFGDAVPVIPGARFVPDLTPYIERKLFTVNTGHAATAYHGRLAGHATIVSALADPAIRSLVEAVLAETASMLVAKHGGDPAEQDAYVRTTLDRFVNPALDDRVERVGRQPIRKLGRRERFVGPAAAIAESGVEPVALLGAMGAALRFDYAGDEEAVRLQRLLRDGSDLVGTVMGLSPADPLFSSATGIVESVR